MRRVVLSCALAGLLAGCAKDMVDEQVGRLRQGMDTVEVSSALGAPMNLHRGDGREAWQYCWKGVLQDAFLVAWLVDDVLDDWEVRGSTEFGDCPTLMESVVWPEDREVAGTPAS